MFSAYTASEQQQQKVYMEKHQFNNLPKSYIIYVVKMEKKGWKRKEDWKF